jgi:outer membrane protein
MKPILSIFLAWAVALTTITAQNFGYVKTDELLTKLPEVKTVDSELQQLQKVLAAKRDAMLKDLQTRYQDLQSKEQQGLITRKQLEEQTAVLQQDEEALRTFEEEMAQKYDAKKTELLQPILEKINDKIKEVAKEGSFTYIFDWGSGVLLYADETKDVTAKVLAKLGVAN